MYVVADDDGDCCPVLLSFLSVNVLRQCSPLCLCLTVSVFVRATLRLSFCLLLFKPSLDVLLLRERERERERERLLPPIFSLSLSPLFSLLCKSTRLDRL